MTGTLGKIKEEKKTIEKEKAKINTRFTKFAISSSTP